MTCPTVKLNGLRRKSTPLGGIVPRFVLFSLFIALFYPSRWLMKIPKDSSTYPDARFFVLTCEFTTLKRQRGYSSVVTLMTPESFVFDTSKECKDFGN